MAYVTHWQVLVFVFCLLFSCLSVQIHVRLSICDAFTPVVVYFPFTMLQNRCKSYRDYFLFTCVTVKRHALTFRHRRYRCTGSQGLPDLGYGPLIAVVWLLRAGKAIAGGFPPTAIARDVTSYTSYRIPSRWRIQCYVTIYVIYIPMVAAPLSQGVLLPLRNLENLSTPLVSWVTMIFPQALPGTSAVSKINYLGFSCLFHYCNSDR